jgi:hypothetical protein
MHAGGATMDGHANDLLRTLAHQLGFNCSYCMMNIVDNMCQVDNSIKTLLHMLFIECLEKF